MDQNLIQKAIGAVQNKFQEIRGKTLQMGKPLAESYQRFGAQPVPKQLQPISKAVNYLYETKNPLIAIPSQFSSGLISGQNLNMTPVARPAETSGEKLAYGLGSFAGALNPKGVTGKITQTVVKATNPLLSKAVEPIANKFTSGVSKLVAPRIASGIANVGQGLVLNPALGQQSTPIGMGIDFAAGVLGGPKQFDNLSAITNAKPNIEIPKGDAELFYTSKKLLRDYTPEQFTNDSYKAIKDLKQLAVDYLPKLGYTKKEIKTLSANPENIIKILDTEMMANTRIRAGYKPLEMGIYGGEKATGYKEAANKFSNLTDKKPRFEIDDSKAKIIANNDQGFYFSKPNGNKVSKLSDVLDHKELYKQYPELKNISVKQVFGVLGGSDYDAQLNPFKGELTINTKYVKNQEKLKSSLLHEIQHFVQTKEGFAAGGSPETITSSMMRQAKSGETPFEAYRKLAGEVEARDVAARRQLTPEQRSRISPLKSQNVPANEQILNFDTNTQLSKGLTPEVNKPIKIYRGGTSDSKYYSTSKNIAEDFAKNRGGSVVEKTLSPNAKIINYEDIPTANFKGINDYNMESFGSGKDLLSFQNGKLEADYIKAENWAKQNGYDAVKFPTEGEIRVINPKAVSGLTPEVTGKVKLKVKNVPIKENVINKPSLGKDRGFVTSVQEAENVIKPVKLKVAGKYIPKPNDQLMGEAKALLSEIPIGSDINFKGVKDIDRKVAATIQDAINQQASGNNQAAANLFNNLSEHGTELGRGVQAFSLLKNMSPEAIALSAAGKIKKYNQTASIKIPELNGDQVKMIADKVSEIDLLKGREKNIALNELNNTINEFIPSTLSDKALSVWKAGLLTSFRTHERNFVGNMVHGVAETVKDLPASAADMALSLKTGKRTLTPTIQGIGEFGSKSTIQQMQDIVSKGFDPTEELTKFNHKQITWGKNPVEQVLKKYTDTVFRTLGASDKPFYNAAFARSLYDQAGAEAINANKKGNMAFIKSLVNNPSEKMLKTAINDANVATFKDKNVASSISTALKRELGKNEFTKVMGEITIPFTGVPSSILGQVQAYSPIGLTKGILKAGKVLVQDVPDLQRQASQEIGRGVIGTGIFGLGAYLASKGIITGQPKDATEARQWELENKPRNSILINGKWRSLNSIGPEAVVFLAGSKLNEELGRPEGSLSNYAVGLGKDYIDQSFMTGLQAPVNAITDPARYAKSYGGQLLSSVIPNIAKDVSRAIDPSARETNTVSDYFKAGVPGLRQTLPVRRDVLGNVIPQEPTGIGAMVDVFNSKTPVSNNVVNELSRLNAAGENATPSKLTPSQTILKEKIKLTYDQLNNLEQGIGDQLRPALDTLINSPEYQSLTDEKKSQAIDKTVKDVRDRYKNINAESIKTGILTAPSPVAPSSNTYSYVDSDGNYKTIDLSPIAKPVSTGQTELDKKLYASYNSKISTQASNIAKLYEAGKIDASQAESMINQLNSQKSSTKKVSVKKPKKISVKKISVPKVKKLKVKAIKIPKIKKIKIAKVKQQKLAKLKTKKIKA